MAEAHGELAAARRRLLELERSRATAADRREVLSFQIQELTTAGIRADEEDELRRERDVLRHSSKLLEACREVETALYSGDASTVGILARLGSKLKGLIPVDASLQVPADLIDTARVQLEEAAASVKSYADRLRFDPDRLDQIDERLMFLSRLSRKHGVPTTELETKLKALEAELANFEQCEEDHAEAAALLEARARHAGEIARELSRLRAEAAPRLESDMGGELSALGMKDGKFQIVFQTQAEDELSASGCDSVEFYLSANPGEPSRPLARIASGGELSRVMLALKTLTASAAEAPIMVFDEVDAGIGGMVADAVARRLKLLAANHQLLCITHLPQIAAYADQHFSVQKKITAGRTVTMARALDSRERVTEISRMLGGSVAPQEAQIYARRLIAEGKQPRVR